MSRAALGLVALTGVAACGLEDPPIPPEQLTPPSERVEREPPEPEDEPSANRVTVTGDAGIGAAARF